MCRLYTCSLTLLLVLIALSTSVAAVDWKVIDYYPQADPGSIVFTYDDDVLSINRTSVYRQGGSSGGWSTLHFSGFWGVISSSISTYIPDPLAQFVITGDGSGYIQWAPDAPHGYQAYLLLGHMFDGNGAATYHRTYPPAEDIVGTLVLGERFGQGMSYRSVYHSFEVVNTPEPGSILALGCGMVGLISLMVRRKGRV